MKTEWLEVKYRQIMPRNEDILKCENNQLLMQFINNYSEFLMFLQITVAFV